MARSKNTKIETPGQETAQDDASDLIGGEEEGSQAEPANTAQELNAATAGATVTDAGTDLSARNTALSELNAQGFAVISKFEAYGFVDEQGHPLTNSLEFIDLVKKATETTASTTTAVTSEDGARKVHKAPVMTEHGWHVPG